jgi:hypothetical protein
MSSNLTVDVLAVADLEDDDLASLLINEVDDSVIALADSEPISVARKLFAAARSGVFRQGLNPPDYSQPIGLRSQPFKFPTGRSFD